MEFTKLQDTSSSTTIYIGNLHADATEELICTLFAQFGLIKSCKILREGTGGVDKFSFIEYNEHQAAVMAINTMNGRVVLEKKIKVNWANTTWQNARGSIGHDISNHHPIFVGDISNEITEPELRDAFSKFGEISDIRIIRDPVTMKCKSYGFVTFVKKQDAENAIKEMNGFWVGNRSIRTNWAQKRGISGSTQKVRQKLSYHEVDSMTTPTNSTIFCGNITTTPLSESVLNDMFSRFGSISSIRTFGEKGYGFVNFGSKSSAVRAIIEMNGTDFNGDIMKVSWGKEKDVQVPEWNPIAIGNTQRVGAGNSIGPMSYLAHPGEATSYAHHQQPGSDYWQYMQNYQNMFMQQQHFYQTNAALAANYATGYPFYMTDSHAQSQTSSPNGMFGTGFQSATSGASNLNPKNKAVVG